MYIQNQISIVLKLKNDGDVNSIQADLIFDNLIFDYISFEKTIQSLMITSLIYP